MGLGDEIAENGGLGLGDEIAENGGLLGDMEG